MRSIFLNAPFSRMDLGRQVWSGGTGLPSAFLGQEAVYSLEDYLAKIDAIADAQTRSELRKKYESCQAKGLDTPARIGCLISLGSDINQALKNETKPPMPPAAVPPPAATSTFPIVPVAIAGAAALGLIYYLSTRK